MPDQNGESRLDRIERILEIQAIQAADRHREVMAQIEAQHANAIARIEAEGAEWRARHRETMAEIEAQRVDIESLHDSVGELHEVVQQLVEAARRDGENIARLARIAESHEQRLDDLGEGE